MEEKGIYQVENKPSPELDEDVSENKTHYTNKPYNKLQVNYVEIESVCDSCTTAFSS